MRYRRPPAAVEDREPLTINAEVCARTLDGHGYPRMASFVRNLGDGVQRANQDAMYYRRFCGELSKQLAELKPPQERPHDPRPPAEASD